MLFYIKTKVTIRMRGIAGPFEKQYSALVNAGNVNEAKQKFEGNVKMDNISMRDNAESITFEYLEIAPELK